MANAFRTSARPGASRKSKLAEATTTLRAVFYYETEAGFPPAPAVISLAKGLNVTADELLGLKPSEVAPVVEEDSEVRRHWKRFQMIATLPERDQKAVIRLIHSLAASVPVRKNGAQGERHGR